MRNLFLLLLFVSSAHAADAYVSTTGSDANNCLTLAQACATPARGAAVARDRGTVYLSAGSYYGVAVTAVHGDYVTFVGDCGNRSAVALYGNPGQATLWAQDHATIVVKCLKVGTTGNGSTAIAARQFAIVDWQDMVFGHFPLGKHVSLNEMSKGNCIGTIEVTGDAVVHAQVYGMSSLSLQCATIFSGSPTIGYYLSISENSFALATLATFSGGVSVSNHSYVVDTSVLKLGGVTIPGPAGTNSNGVVQ